MAVIAKRERLGQGAGQGLEAPEMRNPFFVCEAAKAEWLRMALAAMAQNRLREIGRMDGIEEFWPQRAMQAFRAVGG